MQPPPSVYPDVMEDMDQDLLGLLKGGLDSFVKWDLIKFLYRYPDGVHQVAELARRMNREQADLEREANDLARAGIVDCQCPDGQLALALTADPSARQLVDKFMHACEDRCFRMKVVYHIFRGMR